MSVKKKRSKKRSVPSSKPPRKDVPYYLDRNMGKHVIADALRAAGSSVELHDDHLAPDAPDEDWIALVGTKAWLAVTKDKNIRYRAAEIEAIKRHRAKIYVVRAKNATGQEIADLLVAARVKIQRFGRINDAPFVAGIDRSGRITKYAI